MTRIEVVECAATAVVARSTDLWAFPNQFMAIEKPLRAKKNERETSCGWNRCVCVCVRSRRSVCARMCLFRFSATAFCAPKPCNDVLVFLVYSTATGGNWAALATECLLRSSFSYTFFVVVRNILDGDQFYFHSVLCFGARNLNKLKKEKQRRRRNGEKKNRIENHSVVHFEIKLSLRTVRRNEVTNNETKKRTRKITRKSKKLLSGFFSIVSAENVLLWPRILMCVCARVFSSSSSCWTQFPAACRRWRRRCTHIRTIVASVARYTLMRGHSTRSDHFGDRLGIT